jgi:glycine hydroxymethyltransferase
MPDFLFRGNLAQIDPAAAELNEIEAERQYRKLILIASESTVPQAVREALNSPFNNVYAEGYPTEESRRMTEAEILDYPLRLTDYRRHSDLRYYKGVEYCNTVEALARRRCAELFANERVAAADLYVNVQPLSGGPANNAVYYALVEPNDVVMGLDLTQGGHLSHGAKVNRSGRYYKSVPYTIDPKTQKLDYQAIRELARKHRPKLLIAGYSAYPWPPDWAEFRSIADEVGAYLLADIAHVASLVVAGEFPSPVGIADVVSFTTHKSLNGPRGAVLLTHRADLSAKIDKAVFPGEQGGPHLNTILGIAVGFRINQSQQFRELQKQIRQNAAAMADRFRERGFRIPYGGTATHLVNLDCSSVVAPDGTPLKGDQASRILDLAGIVVNRNTIPGDSSALNPSGIRLGTGWISQRGFTVSDSIYLADLIADLLQACQPFYYRGQRNLKQFRARVDFDVFNRIKCAVHTLAQGKGIDFVPAQHGYPHFYYADQPTPAGDYHQIEISGSRAAAFLQPILSNDVLTLTEGQAQATSLRINNDDDWVAGVLQQHSIGYTLTVPADKSVRVITWLRDLADGYVLLDSADQHAKAAGPVVVQDGGVRENLPDLSDVSQMADYKPYFYGARPSHAAPALPDFDWQPDPAAALRRTQLFAEHQALGAKLVAFGGYEMPVWYRSVSVEHQAVRSAAGLFDVSHMAVFSISGTTATEFLNAVCPNDLHSIAPGESLYTHLLDCHGQVLDDLMVYQVADRQYLLVVNAGNAEKDWAWLQALQAGTVCIASDHPASTIPGRDAVQLQDLRQASAGAGQLSLLALQGPASWAVLQQLGAPASLGRLPHAAVQSVALGEWQVIVARTGYAGERAGYELFVHPDQLVALWRAILAAGQPLGVLACGLAARDSLRTEAGLPLYGHELAGPLKLGVGDAGLAGYVKTHKPWFIGRGAFLAQEAKRTGRIARFQIGEKGQRLAKLGDPVVDKRGRVVGTVTSCALDSAGLQTGLAFLEADVVAVGTPLQIFCGTNGTWDGAAGSPIGSRVVVPAAAVVLGGYQKG